MDQELAKKSVLDVNKILMQDFQYHYIEIELDLSKVLMQDFCYNYNKNKYGDKT